MNGVRIILFRLLGQFITRFTLKWKWDLMLGKHGERAGLFCRSDPKLSPIVTGQLLAAYPDLRIEQLEEKIFAPLADAVWFSARLLLKSNMTKLLDAEQFVDREERQLADPLAAILK